jgi:hypothetical protein
MIDCKEMVRQHLKQNGFDGLYAQDACACDLSDLMPCGGDGAMDCRAGYKASGCDDDCGRGCGFHILGDVSEVI